jgi:CheY-like chemotaxis protein
MRLFAEVEDTGPGIPQEDIHKIFEKFEQTAISIRKGGTGLGLSISRQFALMMGGDITVKSIEGKGSIFYLELKFKPRKAPALNKIPKNIRISGLEQKQVNYRILIVDDEPANRKLLMDLLGKVGFDVVEAFDGRDALIKFKEKMPDLVFLDVSMPVMNGYEAIKIFKSLKKDVPVIAVTATVFDENRKIMMSAGFDGFIRKPYKIYEIYDVLQSKLGVRYTYETPIAHAYRAAKITKEMLADLPEKLINQMLEAAVRVDLDRLLELIDETSKKSPVLSVKLGEMAKSFQYDELINVLKGKI